MLHYNIQLVIPMSGSGKRFQDAGYTRPKPLINVDDKPMIQHVLSLFPDVKDVIFICNKDHLQNTDMAKILAEICPYGKIVAIDAHKKGPVYAVAQAFEHLSNTKEIIVSYCDYGTYWNFNKFLEQVRAGKFDGALACYKGFHPHMLGSDNYAFCKEENNVLLEIKEKSPFTDNKMSEYASNGTYYFRTGAIVKKYFQALLDLDLNINGEYYVSLVYNLLVRDGLKSLIFAIENMLQWGTPPDLEIYQGWAKYFTNTQKPILTKQNYTLILPMAGKGQRFSKDGYQKPKPLIPVDEIPMFVRAVDCLPIGQKNIFISLKEHNAYDLIKRYFPDSAVHELDDVTDGQATTCEIGIKLSNVANDTPILISACDNGVMCNEQKFIDLINDETIDIIVWSFRNSQASKNSPNSYSWLSVDDEGFVRNVSCKKFIGNNPLKEHAIIGTMYFRKAEYFLDGLNKNRQEDKRTNGEFYVDDVLNQNIARGLRVKVFEVDHYVCWGTPDDYKTYNYWKNYFINHVHSPRS